MANDWWTGSPKAGLDRALAMGGPPPPGSMPAAMMNAYRMAPAEPESGGPGGNFDVGRTRAPAVSRGEIDWQGLLAAFQREKRKKPTAQDAGDALAGSSLG